MKRNKGSWISLGGAVVLVLQALGEIMGFSVDSAYLDTIISSICGFLVIVGVLLPDKDNHLNIPTIDDQLVDDSNEETKENDDTKTGVDDTNDNLIDICDNDKNNIEKNIEVVNDENVDIMDINKKDGNI